MRPLLIVNPRSGGGRTGGVFDQMRRPIEARLGEVDVALTERPRHAVDLAREAAKEGRELVVAVGGDGSIHEVVTGLMLAADEGAKAPRLGIVGQGTGGDFRKTLGIEHRLDRYCEAIASGRARPVDVARIRYVDQQGKESSGFFVNILSAGIGGLVDRYVAEGSRALGGTAAYLLASLRGLVESEIGILECRISEDGRTREEEIRTRSIAVCNGRYFGSGMHVAPMASPSDGALDVVDLGGGSKLHYATFTGHIYRGTHVGRPGVRHFRCQKISMRLANPGAAEKFLLDVDGEPLGRLPLEIELVPGALSVMAP